MKRSEPLTIDSRLITNIKKLSILAVGNPEQERQLYCAITKLNQHERTELYDLYMLGRGGLCSYNVTLASAHNQNPQHVAATLAEKRNLASCVNLGLRRHARHLE